MGEGRSVIGAASSGARPGFRAGEAASTRTSSAPRTGGRPVTLATWNGVGDEPPVRAMARPGVDGSIAAASGDVDDVLGVGPVRHPRRDPQGDVGPDVRRHRARRALGGQHEVHAERAAHDGGTDQSRDELRQFLAEHPELVDHDDQPRQRRHGRRTAGGARADPPAAWMAV